MKQYNPYQQMHHKAVFRPVVNQTWTGTWNLMYGSITLIENVAYPIAKAREKEFKRMGVAYPNKELFKIKPCKP